MRPPRFMLRGNVWLEVQGAEPSRFLNRLAEAGLAFWDAEPEDDLTLRLAVRTRDLEAAKSLAAR